MTPPPPPSTETGTFRTLVRAMGSWRTLSVTLLSFSSGLPLGLVWITIPDWMSQLDFDIRVIGLSTLTHAPWTFKVLWAPLMDRYAPPWFGRRRGWILLAQVALFALTLVLGGAGAHPDTPWVILGLALAIAFASASQDIVIDAYAVEVLRKDERGVAVGARTAAYRLAMQGIAAVAITLTAQVSWFAACAFIAVFYLPSIVVALRAPEPETRVEAPRSLRESVWLPFLGALSRHRALEILAFVFFYKFADQLAQSLQRPFFEQLGYTAVDRGVGLAAVGLYGTIGGTFLGGALTTTFGLTRCLWVFGVLQILTNIGYILMSRTGVDHVLFYSAMTFETVATGLGMGAYGVLLLAMTQRRFSATQYALFSSLFAIPRLIAGPVTGAIVHSVGWTWFFAFTMIAGIPGLVLLSRFAPWGSAEPEFTIEPPHTRQPLSNATLVRRGLAGGVIGFVAAVLILAALDALRVWTKEPQHVFDLGSSLTTVLTPSGWSEISKLSSAVIFGVVCGLATAAVLAARHGAALEPDERREG